MSDRPTRRVAIGLGITAALLASPVVARQADEFESGTPLHGRISVLVHVNDAGPYRFVVDTAANTSVVSASLAGALNMAPAGQAIMHTVVGPEVVDMVNCRSIQSGALRRRDIRLAVASGVGLDGADGLIGTDLLRSFRLVLNFRGIARTHITNSLITPKGFLDPTPPSARMRVEGETRFGRLLKVPAWVGGIRVDAIIDTGARYTIANNALIDAVNARAIQTGNGADTQRVLSPTGAGITARIAQLPQLTFAGAGFQRPSVLFGDFHIFRLWDLADRPALLIGVDLLGMLASVIIDLPRGELILHV